MELLGAGATLVVASPAGGVMPIDPRTLPDEEQKITWAPALAAAENTLPLRAIEAAEFDAIFIPAATARCSICRTIPICSAC